MQPQADVDHQKQPENYRSCMRDCASVMKLNPSNIKAWYRCSSACLALDKLAEARDTCARGLAIDPTNTALQTQSAKIDARAAVLARSAAIRAEREERIAREANTLRVALAARRVTVSRTSAAPDLEDATARLADPLDATSALSVPVLVLYPLASQSDLVKAWDEKSAVSEHLAYLLPTPWDGDDGERVYTLENIECFVPTAQGGLAKLGKKVALRKLMESGKVELVDGLMSVFVLPKAKSKEWIEEYKITKGVRK
jgi:hypothetical protein